MSRLILSNIKTFQLQLRIVANSPNFYATRQILSNDKRQPTKSPNVIVRLSSALGNCSNVEV